MSDSSQSHQPVTIQLSRIAPDPHDPDDHDPIVVTRVSFARIGALIRMTRYSNEGAEREGWEFAFDSVLLSPSEMDMLVAAWQEYKDREAMP